MRRAESLSNFMWPIVFKYASLSLLVTSGHFQGCTEFAVPERAALGTFYSSQELSASCIWKQTSWFNQIRWYFDWQSWLSARKRNSNKPPNVRNPNTENTACYHPYTLKWDKQVMHQECLKQTHRVCVPACSHKTSFPFPPDSFLHHSTLHRQWRFQDVV